MPSIDKGDARSGADINSKAKVVPAAKLEAWIDVIEETDMKLAKAVQDRREEKALRLLKHWYEKRNEDRETKIAKSIEVTKVVEQRIGLDVTYGIEIHNDTQLVFIESWPHSKN